MMKQGNIKFISLVFTNVPFLLLFVFVNISIAQTWSKVVDYGDAGYSETGVSWRTYPSAQSYNGSYRYLSHWESDVARVGTATWTTTILRDGFYRVAVSYRQTENRSPDANYFATKNISGELEESVINQQGPVGLIWRTLGVYFYYEGQVVKVLIDGTDDNYSDCADAVSWTLVDSHLGINFLLSSLLLKPERVTLTISKDGPGNGTITSIPAEISCGSICSRPFIKDTVVVLTVNSDRGSFFTGWSGNDCSGLVNCSVTMDLEKNINATFDVLPQYDLNVSVTGTGMVSTSPVSADGNAINCTSGTCSGPFYQDESVTLTATEDRSSSFSGWTGDCTATANPLEATVNMGAAPKDCNAMFVDRTQHDLTVTLTGTGTGTVTSSPVSADGNAINCTVGPCSKPYWDNDTVTLTPVAGANSHFVDWKGDPDCTDGVVTMNTVKNCDATFDIGLVQHTLTVTNASCDSSYGDVSTTPNLIDCSGTPESLVSCSADLDYNSAVTLTANVKSGTFAGWLGDCTVTAINPREATVIMDDDKTCGAVFCGF